MYRNISEAALKGIALAMGVAVVVLGMLGALEVANGVAMSGFGLLAHG